MYRFEASNLKAEPLRNFLSLEVEKKGGERAGSLYTKVHLKMKEEEIIDKLIEAESDEEKEAEQEQQEEEEEGERYGGKEKGKGKKREGQKTDVKKKKE